MRESLASPSRLDRRADHVVVRPGTTIGEAARIMKEYRVGCVLIEKEGRLLGIFTERDILTSLSERDTILRRSKWTG